MRVQKQYQDITVDNITVKQAIGYDGNLIDGLYVSDKSIVYGKDDVGYYIIKPYLNTYCSETYKWKNGYYKFHFKGRTYNLHWILARAFIPGYELGLVVDHIDNDSTNNNISNLRWITKSENTSKFWKSLNEEQMTEYKNNYINGLKKAHAEGKYKEHLNRMIQRMQNKGE